MVHPRARWLEYLKAQALSTLSQDGIATLGLRSKANAERQPFCGHFGREGRSKAPPAGGASRPPGTAHYVSSAANRAP